jgi:tetratricopeptide (TPR) repeat protein
MRRKTRVKRSNRDRPSETGAAVAQPRRDAWATAGVCFGLLVIVAVVFGQTVGFDFVNLDDGQYVYQNPQLATGFTARGVYWAFTETERASIWHPLTWLSLMLDYQFYGLDHPGGYHLTNVLLHAATAVLLFLVLRQVTGNLWPSAFVAAIFAAHPLHVESVAWVTERKDVLSGLFGVLALGAYGWYTQRPGVLRYLAVVGTLALGLLAKPMLVTWPFLFLLLDYWPLKRCFSAALLLEKVPLLLLVAASAIFTFLNQKAGGAVASLETMPMWARILRAAVLYVNYIGKTLLPMNLAVYPAEPLESVWSALGAVLLLAMITAFTVWRARLGERWLVVGWFWYLGTLLPTIGLIQVGTEVRADRFLYLPQIGLCIALAWSVASFFGRRANVSEDAGSQFAGRWACGAAAIVIVTALAATAYRQTGYWRDSEALWTHTLACTGRNCVAHCNFGHYLLEHKRANDAIDQLQKAVSIKPDFAEAEYDLGNALNARGQPDMAIAHFEKAVAIKPDFADAYGNLGMALALCGRPELAIGPLERSLALGHHPVEARTNLGCALADCGRSNDAIGQFRQALKINPEYADAHYRLAAVLLRTGQTKEAIEHYQAAVKLKPGNPGAENNLGVALLRANKYEEAAAHFRKALQIKPDYVEARRNLQLAQSKRP